MMFGVLLFLTMAFPVAALRAAALTVDGLRCEYRVNPVGMDAVAPRLSWVLEGDERGQKQTAYQVLAASSPEALAKDERDLWDTGKLNSSRTIQVVYQGKPLVSRQRVYWKVRVWDKDDRASSWSAPGSWIMGLLESNDWAAKWIADPQMVASVSAKAATNALPAAMFRKTFGVDGPVRRATVYATALGLYELRLNGLRVGDQLLAPEWTNYLPWLSLCRTHRIDRRARVGFNRGAGVLLGRAGREPI